MKNLFIFVLFALTCYCSSEEEQVKDISPQNVGAVPNVMDGKTADSDVAADESKKDSHAYIIPADEEKDAVKAGDGKKDDSPRSLDGNNRIPEDPAIVQQSSSLSTFKEFEMKDGKILMNKAGGEETVVDGNGKITTTKFGDSPIDC